MTAKTQAPVRTETKPLNVDRSGILQRKCDCGKSASLTGQCSECNAKNLLQRRSTDQNKVSEVPPIVHEVLPYHSVSGNGAPDRSVYISSDTFPSLTSLPIQAKLTIGKSGDHYEQEADRVANQVMSMGNSFLSLHQETAIEQEEIQTKRSSDGEFQVGNNLESRLNSSKGRGNPLPDEVRSFMEPRFGSDFSQVRVHTDSEAVQMNQQLNALSFTHKQDVYFGAGKAPAKDGLTAHELAHVVQQTSGTQTQQIAKKSAVQLKSSVCKKEEGYQLRRKEGDDQPKNCGAGTADPFCLGFPSPDTPCKPFPSFEHALSVWALLSQQVPLGAAIFTRCAEVKPVWDTYFAAISTPFSFSKSSSCVVSAAKADPEGSAFANRNADFLHKSIIDNLPITLQGITPVLGAVAERRLPLEEAIGIGFRRRTFLHPDITYNDPSNAAANIAGGSGINGKGSDLFGDDDREMSGTVIIEVATIDPASGMMAGQVRWQPHIHVKDTVDFCPGNLGNEAQKEFTLPMSKLESMGLTRDVPITIDYDLDVRQANFNNVRPLIGPPPPPRPAPSPPRPAPLLPQCDSQFRSRRFACQPTLEACGKGEHRMLRGDNDLEAVKKVQETLGEAKIPVRLDGLFGEKTEQAVAKFKREHSPQILPSDGVVGPKTSHALDNVAIKHGQ